MSSIDTAYNKYKAGLPDFNQFQVQSSPGIWLLQADPIMELSCTRLMKKQAKLYQTGKIAQIKAIQHNIQKGLIESDGYKFSSGRLIVYKDSVKFIFNLTEFDKVLAQARKAIVQSKKNCDGTQLIEQLRKFNVITKANERSPLFFILLDYVDRVMELLLVNNPHDHASIIEIRKKFYTAISTQANTHKKATSETEEFPDLSETSYVPLDVHAHISQLFESAITTLQEIYPESAEEVNALKTIYQLMKLDLSSGLNADFWNYPPNIYVDYFDDHSYPYVKQMLHSLPVEQQKEECLAYFTLLRASYIDGPSFIKHMVSHAKLASNLLKFAIPQLHDYVDQATQYFFEKLKSKEIPANSPILRMAIVPIKKFLQEDAEALLGTYEEFSAMQKFRHERTTQIVRKIASAISNINDYPVLTIEMLQDKTVEKSEYACRLQFRDKFIDVLTLINSFKFLYNGVIRAHHSFDAAIRQGYYKKGIKIDSAMQKTNDEVLLDSFIERDEKKKETRKTSNQKTNRPKSSLLPSSAIIPAGVIGQPTQLPRESVNPIAIPVVDSTPSDLSLPLSRFVAMLNKQAQPALRIAAAHADLYHNLFRGLKELQKGIASTSNETLLFLARTSLHNVHLFSEMGLKQATLRQGKSVDNSHNLWKHLNRIEEINCKGEISRHYLSSYWARFTREQAAGWKASGRPMPQALRVLSAIAEGNERVCKIAGKMINKWTRDAIRVNNEVLSTLYQEEKPLENPASIKSSPVENQSSHTTETCPWTQLIDEIETLPINGNVWIQQWLDDLKSLRGAWSMIDNANTVNAYVYLVSAVHGLLHASVQSPLYAVLEAQEGKRTTEHHIDHLWTRAFGKLRLAMPAEFSLILNQANVCSRYPFEHATIQSSMHRLQLEAISLLHNPQWTEGFGTAIDAKDEVALNEHFVPALVNVRGLSEQKTALKEACYVIADLLRSQLLPAVVKAIKPVNST